MVRDEITGLNYANIVAIEPPIASPPMPAPVMTPPMTPVPVMPPADFFGLEMIDIVLGDDRGFGGLGARRHESLFR